MKLFLNFNVIIMLLVCSVSYSQVNGSKAPIQVISQANQLIVSPASQTITLSSGESGDALVQLNVVGSDPDPVFTQLSIISLDDDGYQSLNPGNTILNVGDVTTATFSFNKNVTSTITSTYVFRLEWSHDGVSNDEEITVNVTYEPGDDDDGGSGDVCSRSPPDRVYNTFIGFIEISNPKRSFAAATITKEFATNSVVQGWKTEIREKGVSSWSRKLWGIPTRTFTDLKENQEYEWRASSCQTGDGPWGPVQTFRTLGGCNNNISINNNVLPKNSDARTGRLLLEASNRIFDNASAFYSSSQSVILKPGFRASTGSIFSAYIEDCSTYPSRSNKSSIVSTKVSKEDGILLYPNPTQGQFSIENKDLEITNWEVYDQFGASQLKNRSVIGEIISVDLTNKRQGIYFMRLTLKSGEIVSKSIIKK